MLHLLSPELVHLRQLLHGRNILDAVGHQQINDLDPVKTEVTLTDPNTVVDVVKLDLGAD